MGKKKKGKGYGRIVAVVLLAMIFAFAGFAAAEQDWLPGYGDKNGRLGKDGQSWRIGFINTLCMEGPTSDGNETCLSASDPSGTNRLTLPDESGELLSTGGGGITSLPLADTQIWIGGSDGLADPQLVTGDIGITNAGVTTIEAGTDGQMMVYNASDGWAPDTHALTGDVTGTMANTGSLATVVGQVDGTAVAFGSPTDANLQIATDAAGGSWIAAAHTLTGDVTGTMTNTGAVATTVSAIDNVDVDFATKVSGNIQIADGSIWNSFSHTLSGDATGTMGGGGDLAVTVNQVDGTAVDFATVTDGYVQAATDAAGGSWDAVSHTLTGPITGTMANTGVVATSVTANSMGLAETNLSYVTVSIQNGSTSGTATVTSGAFNWAAIPFANVDTEVVNGTSITTTTLTVTLIAAAVVEGHAYAVYRVPVLEP